MKMQLIEGSELRFFEEPLVLKRDTSEGNSDDAASRTVEGYALKFGVWSKNLGWFKEQIDSRALDEADMSDVVALFNHDMNLILARTLSKTLTLTIDKVGLKYSFEAPNTSAGDDLIESLTRKDIQSSSFQFTVKEDSWEYDKEGNIDSRTILKIERLIDVSPVVFPAYPQADVAKRSFEEWKAKVSERDALTNEGHERDARASKNLMVFKRKLMILKSK